MANLPLELLNKSQRLALTMASDSVRRIRATAAAGAATPELAVRQMVDLVEAIGGLANASAQPLQDFIIQQRELANTVSRLAEAQAELASIVATLAQGHADAVNALESVTAPVFGVIEALPGGTPAPTKKAVAKKPAKRTSGSTSRSKTSRKQTPRSGK